MSVNITSLTTDRTFSNWVDTTNELITFASTAVTLDSNNAGNIGITGNITLDSGSQIGTNLIAPVSGDKLEVNSKLQTNDDILIDKSSGDCTLQFKTNGTDSFFVKTASTHTALVLGKGTHHITLADDGNITASGRIDLAMLPENISLDGNLTVSTGTSTLSTVTISAGNISGLTTLGTADNPVASAIITSADINGGTIDGVTIGGTTAGAGSFTTMDASGDATVGGNLTVTGTITGDVTGTSTVANSLTQAALTQVFNAIYPIGSLYYTINDEDPATTFGGGWSRYGQGRAIVGFDDGLSVSSASHSGGTTTVTTSSAHYFAAGDVVNFSGFGAGNGNFTVTSTPSSTQFKVTRSSSNVSGGGSRKIKLASADAVNVTSGRNSITQTVSQMPSHTHKQNNIVESTNMLIDQSLLDTSQSARSADIDSQKSHGTTTFPRGGGDPMNIQNRNVIVYIWKRDSLA